MAGDVRTRLTAADAAIMGLLLVLALVLILLPLLVLTPGSTVAVRYDFGKEQILLPLEKDTELVVSSAGYQVTIGIKDGSVRVTASDCEDQICVKSPAISRSGEAVVCAPAGVTVTVLGEGEGADIVVG